MRILIVGDGEARERAEREAARLGATLAGVPGEASAVVGVGSDTALVEAARLAGEAGVKHPHDVGAAVRGTDFAAARAALAEAHVPQPAWRECCGDADLRAAASGLGLPLVVRSLDDAVHETVADEAALLDAGRRAIAASSRAACVAEAKIGGGCSRGRREDVDRALGCAALVKVVGDEVVFARALLADCSPEQAVQAALGGDPFAELRRLEACDPA